jgi:hypothetical protein
MVRELTQGELLRDNALANHEQKYDNWLLDARRAAYRHARDHGTVCADDVQRLCPPPPWVHHNAMGAVFKNGFFEHDGFTLSKRPQARARTIRTYRIKV